MSTHSFTHEYKRVSKKQPNGEFLHISQYLGSRCRTKFCGESRNRQVLPLVKQHNEQTGAVLFPAQSRHVQK